MISGPIGKGIGRKPMRSKETRGCGCPAWPRLHDRECRKYRGSKSEKQKARERAMAEHRRLHPTCELPQLGEQPCWGDVTVHHVMPTSLGGTTGDQGPLVTLCFGHHDLIERNRAWAKAAGLLLRRDVAK